MKRLIQPQADNLDSLLRAGGVVPSSEWTNGSGRFITRRTVPPYCRRMSITAASVQLCGEVEQNFKRLIKARPRVEFVVAVTDLRGARRALRERNH